MKKEEAEQLTNDVLIADALITIKTIAKLLITKGVFTQEEFDKSLMETTTQITKSILQKANVPGDLDQIIADLKNRQN